MTIGEIIGYGGGGLFLLLTLVQIAPLKINPWTYLARKIGRMINGEVLEEVSKLDSKICAVDERVDALSYREDKKDAKLCRARILRFGDEILHGMNHSKDHFDQILLDITEYSQYCESHPDFANHVTKHTEQEIEDTYQRLLNTNGFL